MKRLIFCALMAFAVSAASLSAAAIKIVTTTADLASLAKSVGGNRVTADSIVLGNRDPHFIDAKPSYMLKVSRCNLFIAIGLELEIGYEKAILDGAHNPKVQIGTMGHMYASDYVPILEKPTGRVTRAQGDVHPFGNPHIWLDPYNARIIAKAIAERLGKQDPSGDKIYDSNFSAFALDLDEHMFGESLVKQLGGDNLWDWERSGRLQAKLAERKLVSALGGWAKKMLPFSGRNIVTYHRSWAYFASRFNLNIVGELEPKPGIPPSPSHTAEILNTVKSRRVGVILSDTFYPTNIGRYVAKQTGAKLAIVPLSVGALPEAKDYLSLIDLIVNRVAGAFGG